MNVRHRLSLRAIDQQMVALSLAQVRDWSAGAIVVVVVVVVIYEICLMLCT